MSGRICEDAPLLFETKAMLPENLCLQNGEIILGFLENCQPDFPWLYCRFIPTKAYETVKPLFDMFCQVPPDDDDLWGIVYDKIAALGLKLVDMSTGRSITEFILYIEEDGRASFRYTDYEA